MSRPTIASLFGSKFIFAFITMAFLALPAVLYFSQKGNIADIRSRATNPYGSTCNGQCVANSTDCTNPPPLGLGGTQGSGSCGSTGSLFCCFLGVTPTPAIPTPTSASCTGAHNCTVVTLSQCVATNSCGTTGQSCSATQSCQYQLCYDSNNNPIKCFYGCIDDSTCKNITPTLTPLPTPSLTTKCYEVTNNQCGFHCPCNQIDVADTYCDNGSGPVYWGSRCDSTTPNSCTCGGPSATPTQKPPPNNTSTPTPIPGQCLNIKIYKNGVVVDPTTLRPGDVVIFAVSGSSGTTKAHFRVNGAQLPGDTDSDPNWTESTTLNGSGEYVSIPYSIPSGIVHILVEAEVFANGIWY